MDGQRCLCLLGGLWGARSQLAGREVLAVRRVAARNRMVPNSMVPNSMVPVGGELGVAITTEQERIKAAFHEGTPALHTGAEQPRGTRPPVYLQKRKYGAGGPAWVPYKPQNRAWGHRRGNVDRVVVVFSSVPRSGASRGRNAPFLGSRIYEFPFYRALNVQIVSFFGK